MTDRDIKNMASQAEPETFTETAFTLPPPLSAATVAVVTSASLHHADQEDFAPNDTGYRVLDNNRRDYQLGHWSPNFDTLGYAADYNTVIPLSRLDELAEAGTIGAVADIHLSYAGNQFDLSAIKLDSGPAGAALLKQKGVDVVLLTPV